MDIKVVYEVRCSFENNTYGLLGDCSQKKRRDTHNSIYFGLLGHFQQLLTNCALLDSSLSVTVENGLISRNISSCVYLFPFFVDDRLIYKL